MTKKDYIVIAAAIRETRDQEFDHSAIEAIDRVAERIADKLQADNPRFNRQRFLEATR